MIYMTSKTKENKKKAIFYQKKKTIFIYVFLFLFLSL